MIDSTAVGDLRAAFSALAQKKSSVSDTELRALQRRVYAAVDEMKAAGVLPEHVIVAVKGLAADCGIQWTDDKLFEHLVLWCVDRYYAESKE